jgi:hypothetical protein
MAEGRALQVAQYVLDTGGDGFLVNADSGLIFESHAI